MDQTQIKLQFTQQTKRNTPTNRHRTPANRPIRQGPALQWQNQHASVGPDRAAPLEGGRPNSQHHPAAAGQRRRCRGRRAAVAAIAGRGDRNDSDIAHGAPGLDQFAAIGAGRPGPVAAR